jgi:KilA-N domain
MKKEIKDYLNNKSTKEFIQTMIEDKSIIGGITPILTTRGKNGGTWMHPYDFMDYAMWINPKFKLVV